MAPESLKSQSGIGSTTELSSELFGNGVFVRMAVTLSTYRRNLVNNFPVLGPLVSWYITLQF